MTATRDRQSDPAPGRAAPGWANRAAFGDLKGLPWWGVGLLTTAMTVGGILLDLLVWSQPNIFFKGFYFVGCLLALGLVARKSLFGPIVQAPLILAVAMPVVVFITGKGVPNGAGLSSTLLAVANPLINSFPTMAVTTAVTLVAGLLRMFVLERYDRRNGTNADARTRKSAGRPGGGKKADGGKKAGGGRSGREGEAAPAKAAAEPGIAGRKQRQSERGNARRSGEAARQQADPADPKRRGQRPNAARGQPPVDRGSGGSGQGGERPAGGAQRGGQPRRPAPGEGQPRRPAEGQGRRPAPPADNRGRRPGPQDGAGRPAPERQGGQRPRRPRPREE